MRSAAFQHRIIPLLFLVLVLTATAPWVGATSTTFGVSHSSGTWSSSSSSSYPATLSRRRSHSYTSSSSSSLAFLGNENNSIHATQLCSTPAAASSSLGKMLLRGAVLRIASDVSGGTVLENIKTRVTVQKEDMFAATRNIIRDGGGLGALWRGTPTRTIEGALIGGLFLIGSAATKKQLLAWGAPKTIASLGAGVMGGMAQTIVMTPAGMIFTALYANKNDGQPGYQHQESAVQVTARIIRENGLRGLYAGNGPMLIRQASNWASRAGLTEVARTTLGMSKYGLLGEIGAGVFGGVGSCWNTPIETIRVVMCRDKSRGIETKTMMGYWHSISEAEGWQGLFRGVTPRGIQAIWQTVFMVVVPNLMGI